MLKLNWNVEELNFRRCVYVQSREERPEKVQADLVNWREATRLSDLLNNIKETCCKRMYCREMRKNNQNLN